MAVLARLEMAFPTVEYLLNRSLVSSPLEGFASVWMVAPLGEREKGEYFFTFNLINLSLKGKVLFFFIFPFFKELRFNSKFDVVLQAVIGTFIIYYLKSLQ